MSTGTTFTMLWSQQGDAWEHYGMNSTSDVLLLDASGNRVSDVFPWSEQRVTETLNSLA